MAFQFCCPQGHVLQGELSQVGQLFQCPMCGSNFLIPPPSMDPAAAGSQGPGGGFFQGAGTWSGGNAPGPSFPTQGPMPGMMPPQGMPPQSMPTMPGGPMPGGPMSAGPMSGGSYPLPPPQPFAFGPMAVNPSSPNPAAGHPLGPAETPPQPSSSAQNETGRPGFDLGFDPGAKASLPFEIPGQSDSEGAPPAAPFSVAPLPAPSFPAPSFPGGTVPAPAFSAPSMPAPAFTPSAGGQDFLQSAPAGASEAAPDAAPEAAPEEAAPQTPPKVLHIRCPSGHLVKAKSDLLGKNGRCPACKITFELRYEDSVEFQRRTQKILHREEIKIGRAWMAWAFLASFIVFAGLVALMLAMSR